MRQFSCECGFTVKWSTVDGIDPPLILQLTEDHSNLGHEEVEPWQAARIRDSVRASYRRQNESLTVQEGKIMDQLMRASRR